MSRILPIAFWFAIVAGSARGDVSIDWIDVDNSDGGEALADYRTSDILIDFTGEYRGAQALIQLEQGSIYQWASFGFDPIVPNPVIPPLPEAQFDTLVSQGSFFGWPTGEPVLNGGAVGLGGAAKSEFNTSAINQAWGPAEGVTLVDQTDFLIGRFTLSKDAIGTAKLLVATDDETYIEEFSIVNGAPPRPPVARDDSLHVFLTSFVVHQFSAYDPNWPPTGLEWSDLVFTGNRDPGPNRPTLDSDGRFAWDWYGADKFGTYTAIATVTNAFGLSDTARLTITFYTPEPGSLCLVGLAALGWGGIRRKRR